MLLVVLLGLLGYMLIAGMPFLHALYATVITVTTVGYEDRALSEVTDPVIVNRVMIFEIVLVIIGISVVAYAFSLFVSSLVEGEIRDAIGLHRTKRRLLFMNCLLYTSPSPRDVEESRMPSSA